MSAALLRRPRILRREGYPVHTLLRGSHFLPTHSLENLSSFKLEIMLLKIGENKEKKIVLFFRGGVRST